MEQVTTRSRCPSGGLGFVSLSWRAFSCSVVGTPVAAHAASAVPSAKPPIDSPSVTSPRTVLLVDDEQRMREVVRIMLERAGHRVVEAESAEDAITQFSTMESVDLLVSDLQMPGMSGLELFDRLVERRPSLRVLFISGAASAADLDTIRHKGAVLLEKPFSAQALANKVREVLR